jgi:hypothetical protein
VNAITWLRDRGDSVPVRLEMVLLARAQRADETDETGEGDVTESLIGAASEQLSRVLDAQPMTRAQALDLLAADAFATYALEAAADDPASLADRADAAMRMFAEAGPAR